MFKEQAYLPWGLGHKGLRGVPCVSCCAIAAGFGGTQLAGFGRSGRVAQVKNKVMNTNQGRSVSFVSA